ncbi:hypothetical protein AS026_30360 [Rhizobium altiplani]|uniref:Uncharacterized protein n=1 Tax=Rhizobium altiplani TaxID=1864509 RepID=A0A120FQG1_9HYPH|nr:hypothetical protein AS026_30360 [Rhizobium altiplani]
MEPDSKGTKILTAGAGAFIIDLSKRIARTTRIRVVNVSGKGRDPLFFFDFPSSMAFYLYVCLDMDE